MEKRFQVFISSTFRDLIDERQALQRAILELNHFPAGMELFPAGDDTAWDLIKDVIAASDYYALIIGGRYGSLDQDGIGYTEKEYDYAVSLKKPVIPLLHKDADSLPRGKTETDEEPWNRLVNFRSKVEKRHTCVYWASATELQARIIVGLTSAIKRHPAEGWVRANEVPSDVTLKEMLALRQRVTELEKQLAEAETSPPVEARELQQGDDVFEVVCTVTTVSSNDTGSGTHKLQIAIYPTWNEIFAEVAPLMINENNERHTRYNILKFFERIVVEKFEGDTAFEIETIKSNESVARTCIVQLLALGLIRESKKTRSLKDTETYWTLTPYGNYTMVKLRALRKNGTVPSLPPSEMLERAIPVATQSEIVTQHVG